MPRAAPGVVQAKRGRARRAMATAKPKISIKIRVVLDAKTAGEYGKLYDESIKVQTVVNWYVAAAVAACCCSSVLL